MSILLFLLQPG